MIGQRGRSLGLLCLVALASAMLLRPASGQTIDDTLWGADAGVGKMARIGSTLYVAGGFTRIGPNSGGGVPLDAESGEPLRPYARVAGEVYVSVPDGAGGWFIGGEFSAVGGQPHANLAHVLRDGIVSPWRADTDGRVDGLALDRGTLYVGGQFSQVAGQNRHCIASLRVASGALTAWNPEVSGIGAAYTTVYAMLVRGETMYVGGDFTTIGGESRRNLAALDLASGRAKGLTPDAEGRVYALELADSTLYVGGGFWTIGGLPYRRLAAVSTVTGQVRAWDARLGSADYDYDVAPYVRVLRILGRRLYLAGHFTRAGGQFRGGVAALDLVSSDATDWNPNPIVELARTYAPFINAIAIQGDLAYIGGRFDVLGGQSRENLAAVSLTTGAANEFNPKVGNDVYAVATSGKTVYAGGVFVMLWDWQPRNGLAAFDLDSGKLLPWSPDPGGGLVMAIAADRGAIYLGGIFSHIDGEPRSCIAAVDPATGALTSWNPGADGFVYSIAPNGGTIYVGGWFTSIGGLRRYYIAAIDSASGVPTPWDPGEGGIVRAIVPAGSTIFVGGDFQTIGGEVRLGLAEVDAVTGLATPWNPGSDGTVLGIAPAGNVIYACGNYWHIGGAARTGIAALDRVTGLATDWNPAPEDSPDFATPHVESILASDGVIYAVGDFRRIGGATRYFLAAVDTATAEATSWNPGAFGGMALCLAERDHEIYVGGGLTRLGRFPIGNFGACSAVPPPRLTHPGLFMAQSTPNPAATNAVVSFVMPEPARATLSVFDLQGRRVASALKDEPLTAGPHDVELKVGGWPIGCYLYRLEAGGATVTRKMLVIK